MIAAVAPALRKKWALICSLRLNLYGDSYLARTVDRDMMVAARWFTRDEYISPKVF